MRWLGPVVLLACQSAPPPPPPKLAPRTANAVPAPSPELSAALQPLAWWRGDWASRDGGTEHWIAAGGALYGVALQPGGRFEVMIVDDAAGPGPADGVLRFYALPGGTKQVVFEEQARQTRGAVFANAAHDHPKTIAYHVDDAGLHAELTGDAPTQRFDFQPLPARRVRALEQADLAFSAATGARGIDGWMAAFEPGGWMLRDGQRVTGAGIADLMRPVLEAGTLAWAPLGSGMLGDLGFTVGTATFTGATPGDAWRSSYVTIWARQPDGTWKVRFDIGRPVNEAATATPAADRVPAAPSATP